MHHQNNKIQTQKIRLLVIDMKHQKLNKFSKINQRRRK